MKLFVNKIFLFSCVIAFTFSCVAPEELPLEVCDPNTEVCTEVSSSEVSEETQAQTDDSSSDSSKENNEVLFKCSGSSFPYANLCSGDTDGLTADGTFTLSDSCTDAKKCEFVCNTGYEPNSDRTGCTKSESSTSDSTVTTEYVCSGSSVSYAQLCDGDTTALTKDETFSLVASCTDAKKCEFVCITGYEPNVSMSGCLKSTVSESDSSTSDTSTTTGEVANPIAAKNYLQLNNSFSSMTGIPTDDPGVIGEFNAIIMQLPSTSDPEALNGFNQIAQTRLGFAYCNVYMDKNFNSIYMNLSNDQLANKLLDSFIDVDYTNNTAHIALKQNLLDILNDTDGLVVEANATNKKRKLSKMACGALLASAYVSMI